MLVCVGINFLFIVLMFESFHLLLLILTYSIWVDGCLGGILSSCRGWLWSGLICNLSCCWWTMFRIDLFLVTCFTYRVLLGQPNKCFSMPQMIYKGQIIWEVCGCCDSYRKNVMREHSPLEMWELMWSLFSVWSQCDKFRFELQRGLHILWLRCFFYSSSPCAIHCNIVIYFDIVSFPREVIFNLQVIVSFPRVVHLSLQVLVGVRFLGNVPKTNIATLVSFILWVDPHHGFSLIGFSPQNLGVLVWRLLHSIPYFCKSEYDVLRVNKWMNFSVCWFPLSIQCVFNTGTHTPWCIFLYYVVTSMYKHTFYYSGDDILYIK